MQRPNFLLPVLLVLCCPSLLRATASSAPAPTASSPDSVASFGRRFSLHTSVIDWALAIPNLGIEWDVSPRRTSRYSLAIHAKYRPNTWNQLHPRFVFNTLQVRGELRRYWRTFVYDEYDKLQRDTTVGGLSSWMSYMRYKRLSGAQRSRARTWRAYYIGIYAAADRFTYHLSSHGRQGSGFGAGLTFGYTLPLYPMRGGASIDLDLGLSIGVRVESYDRFTFEEETHCYVYTGSQARALVKHPALADAHVSFVYRFNSIANKVQDGDKRFQARMTRWAERRLQREDARAARRIRQKEIQDSLGIIKKQKAADKAAKEEQKRKEKAQQALEKQENKQRRKDKAAEAPASTSEAIKGDSLLQEGGRR